MRHAISSMRLAVLAISSMTCVANAGQIRFTFHDFEVPAEGISVFAPITMPEHARQAFIFGFEDFYVTAYDNLMTGSPLDANWTSGLFINAWSHLYFDPDGVPPADLDEDGWGALVIPGNIPGPGTSGPTSGFSISGDGSWSFADDGGLGMVLIGTLLFNDGTGLPSHQVSGTLYYEADYLPDATYHFGDINQCPADRNGDGVADLSDILNVVEAFLNGSLDLNNDGFATIADLLTYLDAYFDGC